MVRYEGVGKVLYVTYLVCLLLIISTAMNELISHAGSYSSIYVGVLNNEVLILNTNGTLYTYRVINYTTYFAIALGNGLIAASGSYMGHPAIALINPVNLSCKLITVPYNGSLFAITLLRNGSIISPGYIFINNTYAGLLLRASLTTSKIRVRAAAYLSSEPTYFRDALELGNHVLVAAGTAFSGRYYPGIAVVGSGGGRIYSLAPRVAGFQGFKVKGLLPILINKSINQYVLALRDGRPYLIGFKNGLVKVYVIKNLIGCFNALPLHISSESLAVFRLPSSPVIAYLPKLKLYSMPASTAVILVNEFGDTALLDRSLRIIKASFKVFKASVTPVLLKGFVVVENSLTRVNLNVSLLHAAVSVKRLLIIKLAQRTLTHNVSATHAGPTSHKHLIPSSPSYGFKPEVVSGGIDLRPLAIGIGLIIIAYLIKRFMIRQ